MRHYFGFTGAELADIDQLQLDAYLSQIPRLQQTFFEGIGQAIARLLAKIFPARS